MSEPTTPPIPARAPAPSLRPALVVVAAAVVVIVGGAALALAGTPSAHQAASHGPASSVPGSKLRAQSAAGVIAHIASGGEPPAGVVRSLAVPAGSRYILSRSQDRGVGPFDRSVQVSVDAPEAEVRTFYLKLLSEQRWVTSSDTAPTRGSTELIAQRNGSDGYQWRVAITLKPIGSLVAPALGGGGASPARTAATISLYQVEDAS